MLYCLRETPTGLKGLGKPTWSPFGLTVKKLKYLQYATRTIMLDHDIFKP